MGKGDNMIGLHDLNITNHLCLLINGGHKSSEMVSIFYADHNFQTTCKLYLYEISLELNL